jgi:hypothetical protein
MRVLGSQALRAVCTVDLKNLGPQVASKLVRVYIWGDNASNIHLFMQSLRLRSMDANDVHGALLSLAEIAKAFKEENHEEERLQVWVMTDSL